MGGDEIREQTEALARGEGDVGGRDGRVLDRGIALLDNGELRVAEPSGAGSARS